VLGRMDLAEAEQVSTLDRRVDHQDALDVHIAAATRDCDAFDLMAKLQQAGVTAGVCQTAEDRCDSDPQLAHLRWVKDLPQSEIGTWPVKDIPVAFEKSQAMVGGRLARSGPSYGEDNDDIYGELLGYSTADIARLREEKAI
jgi:crotonobetainyl-CoA:carnitine CoA-transferase CaiB-like acyl-CoA transferase